MKLVSKMWKTWTDLSPEKRTEIANHLGSVGYTLSIAANVQKFAEHGIEGLRRDSEEASEEVSEENEKKDENTTEEDVIEVEFEEL